MLNKLYYLFKPIVPRKLQMSLRRFYVKYKLKSCSNVWPIDPDSSKKPEWFKGWPEEKKFVFLLTHDVEMCQGLDKLNDLLAIDRKYGFRSSIGLVPERYGIPPDLIEKIRGAGHEVYVHDLNHDGKLFSNYGIFHARAQRINQYIKSWNVCGFRAGAMHHNLDWIGELDIDYDMSTFDTDPFEPMPDGVGTIFPFVASSSVTNKSYVEIPYTIPQDLMALVIHPAQSIDIWIKKIDWIAKNGGMASINVHPDYINFTTAISEGNTYPVEKYHTFLRYVKDRYGSIVWNPAPTAIAKFVNENQKYLV